MAPVSILVWRVRVCVLAVALGLALAHEARLKGPQPEGARMSLAEAKCPAPAVGKFIAVQAPGTEPGDKQCTDAAMARTPDGEQSGPSERALSVSLRAAGDRRAPTSRTSNREPASDSLAGRRGAEHIRTQVE